MIVGYQQMNGICINNGRQMLNIHGEKYRAKN